MSCCIAPVKHELVTVAIRVLVSRPVQDGCSMISASSSTNSDEVELASLMVIQPAGLDCKIYKIILQDTNFKICANFKCDYTLIIRQLYLFNYNAGALPKTLKCV